LKVLTPLMKKKSIPVVPFVIKGTANNPSFELDLTRLVRR